MVAGALGAIGGALASSFPAIASMAGNLFTSAINSSRSWKYTQRAMALQDQLNRNYTRDSYGLMREGLEKAGYNPLLALNSGANSAIYSGSSINSDSDNGAQSVSSALDALRFKNEKKLNDATVEGVKTENDIKEEQLKKLKADNNTSPKVLISKSLDNPQYLQKSYNKVQSLASSLGINLPNLPVSSAVSSKKVNNNIRTIQLHNGKPYVQKGVPRSVVKRFNTSNSAKSSQYDTVSSWNNSNYKFKVQYLDK